LSLVRVRPGEPILRKVVGDTSSGLSFCFGGRRFRYQVGDEAHLSDRERTWVDAARSRVDYLERTPALGLKRALRDAGVKGARLGFDDPRLIGWVNAMGL
jgi:hypothetical protein